MPAPFETLWRLRWRWRTRRFRRAPRLPIALVYHRVCDTALDPLLLGVSPENFAAHMRVLRERCVPLAAAEFAAGAVAGDLPERAVCVTFDDGYADNLHTAQPLLAAHEVPGCIFVATGLITRRREAWWDAVEHVLLHARAAHGSVRLRDETGELEISCPNDDADSLRGWSVESPDQTGRHAIYRKIHAWVHDKSPRVIEKHLETLREWAGLSDEPRPDRRFMTIEEVRTAANASHLTIGGHTVSHPVLSSLAPDEQEREIAEGRRQLTDWTGCAPEVFAYPFGTYDQYKPVTRRAVARAGFTCAFANMPARAGGVNAFEIPRLLVRDWDEAAFARRLGI